MSAGAINILRTSAQDWCEEAEKAAKLAVDARAQSDKCYAIADAFERAAQFLEPAALPAARLQPNSAEPRSSVAQAEDHLIPATVESHTESTASDLPQSQLESPLRAAQNEADPSPARAGVDSAHAASESHDGRAVQVGEGTNSTEALPGSTGRPAAFSAVGLLSVEGAEPGWKAHHEAKKRLAEAAE